MKKMFLSFSVIIMALALSSCINSEKQARYKNETEMTNNEWITLFDGETFDGWRGYGRKDMPTTWEIDDGAIKINGESGDNDGAKDGGDIIFDSQFKNFELTFEWKVSKGGNSGVFYLVEEVKKEPIWKSSLEYQILDNTHHRDAKLGKDNNRQSASLYDLIPAKPQNSRAFGEWNTGSIIVYNGKVIHSQNGEDVLEYHLWTDDWKAMVDNSKFNGIENIVNIGGKKRRGYIGLQDHGQDVWFKNIKVKTLK